MPNIAPNVYNLTYNGNTTTSADHKQPPPWSIGGVGTTVMFCILGLVVLFAVAGGYFWWSVRREKKNGAAQGRVYDPVVRDLDGNPRKYSSNEGDEIVC
jgi:hypothetical protein